MTGYQFTACCLRCKDPTPLEAVTLGKPMAGTWCTSVLQCPICHRRYTVSVSMRPVAVDAAASDRVRVSRGRVSA